MKKEFRQKKWNHLIADLTLKKLFDNILLTYLENKTTIFETDYKNFRIIYDGNYVPLLLEQKEDNELFPSIQTLRQFPNILPKIWVDMGAVKFLLNGANLFRPGITKHEHFAKGSFVQVLNPQNNILCVGKTAVTSDELPEKGLVVFTLIWLNDEVWNFNQIIQNE